MRVETRSADGVVMHELCRADEKVVYVVTVTKTLSEIRRDKWEAMNIVQFPGPSDVERELEAANAEIKRLLKGLEISNKRQSELVVENQAVHQSRNELINSFDARVKAEINELTVERDRLKDLLNKQVRTSHNRAMDEERAKRKADDIGKILQQTQTWLEEAAAENKGLKERLRNAESQIKAERECCDARIAEMQASTSALLQGDRDRIEELKSDLRDVTDKLSAVTKERDCSIERANHFVVSNAQKRTQLESHIELNIRLESRIKNLEKALENAKFDRDRLKFLEGVHAHNGSLVNEYAEELSTLDHQIQGLMVGDGSSEDNQDVLDALVNKLGLSEGTAKRLHLVMCHGEVRLRQGSPG